MASIKCTNCGAVLKTKDPIPPGKKVKCPKCNEAFVVPEEEAETAAAAAGDEVEKPSKSGGEFAFGEEDGEEDGKGKKDKGEKGKKSNTTLIIIIVAAVLLFCCCPTICSSVWYGFGAAIKTAIGIGGAAALDANQKKAQEDAKKLQEEFMKGMKDFKPK